MRIFATNLSFKSLNKVDFDLLVGISHLCFDSHSGPLSFLDYTKIGTSECPMGPVPNIDDTCGQELSQETFTMYWTGFPPIPADADYNDNESTIKMINVRSPTEISRHVDIQHFAILDWKAPGDGVFHHFPSNISPVDDWTKHHIRQIVGRLLYFRLLYFRTKTFSFEGRCRATEWRWAWQSDMDDRLTMGSVSTVSAHSLLTSISY
jgi:hypothetical protein